MTWQGIGPTFWVTFASFLRKYYALTDCAAGAPVL